MGTDYAISRLATDGRPRLYTYSRELFERVLFTLGDDRLEAVVTDEVGTSDLYCVTFTPEALDELEAVLVTHGAVAHDVLPLPPSMLESLGAEHPNAGGFAATEARVMGTYAAVDEARQRFEAMRRHPAGSIVAEVKVVPCDECRRISRLALVASLAGLAAALVALAAVVVAS